jgi:hypothetical protein
MLDVLNVVLPAFIVILIGFLFGKFSKIDLCGVVDILFYVGIPVLAFNSTLSSEIVLADAGKVWASALLVMLGCGAVGWFVFKMLRQKHSGAYLPIILMNTVNIPFAIISLQFGSEGMLVAVLFFIANTVVMNSLGIVIVSGKSWKDGIREMFKVPAIYAVILGLCFKAFESYWNDGSPAGSVDPGNKIIIGKNYIATYCSNCIAYQARSWAITWYCRC